jgi:thiol:disulfide interchange protein DsbC
MMKKYGITTVAVVGVFAMLIATSLQNVFAEDDKGLATVKAALKAVMPRAQPDSIGESAIPGMYEAVYGAQVIYVSADGRYLMEGDLYDMQKRVNLTEEKRQTGRAKAMDDLNEESMIIFEAKGETKYVITAFTDIDCGYCRKLHKEMQDYNDKGIEVRYVSFPRAGLQSPSYLKAVSVWCAADRNKAMTFAKNGAKLEQLQKLEQVDDKTCKDPIETHMKVAKTIGVSGTPTLVMDNGSVLPGYVPADRLEKILKENSN